MTLERFTKVFTCIGAMALAMGEAVGQQSAREMVPDGVEVPKWTVDPEFFYDGFSFARVRYHVGTYGRGHTTDRWLIDAPDSEINFGWRVQQMTSLQVNPNGDFVNLTDPRLSSYPFIYIVEPGRMSLSDEEVHTLRAYLLNGGFLMLDDFWGDREWKNLSAELGRVFPDRKPQDLPSEHPIFSCVFPLKHKPQVPGVETGVASQFNGGITWGRPDEKEPHYQAIFDDKGRMMLIACHNTDNGDGWEREGEKEYYFREFSEKKAYPMGINILVYAMTH